MDDVRRRSVLSQDQAADRSSLPPYQRRSRRPLSRTLVPILFVLVFAAILAYNEVPAVAEAWERLVAPHAWHAKQVCRDAALVKAAQPAYARVLRPGRVHATADGLYVESLVLGEMGVAGSEVKVEYSCYVDSAGGLVRVNRLQPQGRANDDQPAR